MAFTQDDLDAQAAPLKSGEKRVKLSDGREVEYRSVDELLKARAALQAETGTPTGVKRIRQIRMYSDKGLGS